MLDRKRCIVPGAIAEFVDARPDILEGIFGCLLVAQHAIVWNDQLNYSALNQYQRQYSNESGDTMRSLDVSAS